MKVYGIPGLYDQGQPIRHLAIVPKNMPAALSCTARIFREGTTIYMNVGCQRGFVDLRTAATFGHALLSAAQGALDEFEGRLALVLTNKRGERAVYLDAHGVEQTSHGRFRVFGTNWEREYSMRFWTISYETPQMEHLLLPVLDEEMSFESITSMFGSIRF